MSASRVTRIAPNSPATRVTRIAPTPSGLLHLGNAVNFALISLLAATWGAETVLRIDDMDATRARPEFVDDVFSSLHWLDIPWTQGPRNRADFERNFTMGARTAYYRSQLSLLTSAGLELFACKCSRTDLVPTGGLRCAGQCRTAGLDLVTNETALRLRLPEEEFVTMNGVAVDLAAAHGDVVLWRRDGLPSYHLVTVIEDRDRGVTDIVRGVDLLESSALHAWLAPHLEAPNVAQANFVHHALITDDAGEKLSKSQLGADPMLRTVVQRDQVVGIAQGLANALGY